MKRRYALSPSLEQIENRLFGVSDGLIVAVKNNETSEKIAQAVKASPEWADYHASEESTKTEDADIEAQPHDPPEHIKELIRRRVAASRMRFSPSPKSGQVVEVRKVVTPTESEQLDWVIQAPLYVLLDRPGETSELWQGWLVSADTDYASTWDFVLQEQDAPFDPEAGMVQVWNPVRLYLPMAGRVVAELQPERLNAVRAMAADFLLSDEPQDDPWPGRVSVRETSTALKVATGSPIGGTDDPRHRYQNMYHYAAEAVREPANLALAKAGVFEWVPEKEDNGSLVEAVKRWIKGLVEWIRDMPSSMTTTWGPALAFALVLMIGIAMMVPMHENPVDEASTFRGSGDSQVVIDSDPQEKLAQLTRDLDKLKLHYTVSRKDDKVIVHIDGLDPNQPAIFDFLQKNGLNIPATGRMAVEIRKPATK